MLRGHSCTGGTCVWTVCSHVWRGCLHVKEHSYVRGARMWRGHSHVKGNHVWRVNSCAEGLFTCGKCSC